MHSHFGLLKQTGGVVAVVVTGTVVGGRTVVVCFGTHSGQHLPGFFSETSPN